MFWEDSDVILARIITLIIIGFCFVFIFQTFHKGMKEVNEQPPVIEKLYTIDTSSQLSGHFVLGSGRLDEKEYYCCYKLLDDGGKQFVKYPMADTTIYETLKEGDQAYAEIKFSYLGISSYKIYVPENTIMQTYDLSTPK